MIRRTLLPVAICLVFTSVFASPAHASRAGGFGHQDFPPHAGATPIVIGINTSPGGTSAKGILTRAQQQTAASIALGDTRVRALLHHLAFHVAGTSAWTDKGVRVGAVSRIGFARPTAVSGTWLLASGRTYRQTYGRLWGIHVYVDLRGRRVVAIRPQVRR